MSNLASEQNAKKINVQFTDIDSRLSKLETDLKRMELTVATLNNKLDSQTNMYQQFFVKQYGTGSTVKEEE